MRDSIAKYRANQHIFSRHRDRKFADYGYGTVPEPYDVSTADEHLAWANHLVEDLKTLL